MAAPVEYVPQAWVDEVPGETPQKYNITPEGLAEMHACTIVPHVAPTAGTSMNASRLNHAEQGIKSVTDWVRDWLAKRQGGNATNFISPGTTNYSPGRLKIQFGSSVSGVGGTLVVTYPEAYTAGWPMVFVACDEGPAPYYACIAAVASIGTSNFTINTYKHDGTRLAGVGFFWLAIGPMS